MVTSVESHIWVTSTTSTCHRSSYPCIVMFLLAEACNLPTSRRFSDIVDNYSVRCTSRIIFSSSFSITCTLFCKAAIFLSISFRRSFKSWTRIVCLLHQYHPPVALLIESCATLRQNQLRLCKERYHAHNFWAIHTTNSAIRFLLQAIVQTCWSILRCQLNDVWRARLIYNQTGFVKFFDNR